MTWALAAVVVLATAAPHLLPRSRVTPISGVTLWLSVLLVRALLVMLSAVALILFMPATQLFTLVTHWCFHAVIPFLTTHLGFSGHSLGDAAIIVPSILVAVSVVSAAFAIWRGGQRVHGWVQQSSLGAGPRETVIVGGSDVILAATGIRDPKVVVSTGALATLEDDELAAGLEHERGHIARRHPYVATAAELLFAIARVLPGSRAALSHLHFHLERDADEYAIRRTGDPLALASVICKAVGQSAEGPAMIGLAGSGTPVRLRLLTDRSAARPFFLVVIAARCLAILLASIALLLALSSPALARSGINALSHQGSAPRCDH